jgi:hypothetical protein
MAFLENKLSISNYNPKCFYKREKTKDHTAECSRIVRMKILDTNLSLFARAICIDNVRPKK